MTNGLCFEHKSRTPWLASARRIKRFFSIFYRLETDRRKTERCLSIIFPPSSSLAQRRLCVFKFPVSCLRSLSHLIPRYRRELENKSLARCHDYTRRDEILDIIEYTRGIKAPISIFEYFVLLNRKAEMSIVWDAINVGGAIVIAPRCRWRRIMISWRLLSKISRF